MMKEAKELKALQSQRTSIEVRIKVLEAEFNSLKSQISHQKQMANTIDQKIAALKKPTNRGVVSEHALLRFCERHYGANLQEISTMIIDAPLVRSAMKDGINGTFPIAETELRAVVKNGVVVTVK